MQTTTNGTAILHETPRITVWEDRHGVLHASTPMGTFSPSPASHGGFGAAELDGMHRTLIRAGVPETVADRLVNQSQGFDV